MYKYVFLIASFIWFFWVTLADASQWNITHSCEPVTELIQDYLRGNRENQYELEQARLEKERKSQACVDHLSAWEKSRGEIYYRLNEYDETRFDTEVPWEYMDDEQWCLSYWLDPSWVNLPTKLPHTWGGYWPGPLVYSTTNNQKQNVQEPDVSKSNWKNLFSFQWNNIFIYRVDSWWDILQNNLISKINLPTNYGDYWNGWNLLLIEDTLVIVNMPTVLLYDVSNPSRPILQRKISMRGSVNQGYYNDFIREVNGVLYIQWAYYIETLDLLQKFNSVEDVIISPKDYMPVYDDLQLSYDDWNYQLEWTSYPYKFTRKQFDCTQMLMAPSEAWDSYKLLLKIDLKNPEKEIDAVWYMWYPYFHMWEDSIYLLQNDWETDWWLVSKIPYKKDTFWFEFHQEFEWYPIGDRSSQQYSMDENEQWEFRFFVSNPDDQGTDLLVFDSTLQPKSTLKAIQPDEFFQWSMFAWDKAYLVTFRQTDPLFVIDLKDSSDPKILWELKIPWFSEYLHPYGPLEWWIQYLIGLGYDAEEEFWRRTWLKLDLYMVDYNRRNSAGDVYVSQIDSHIRQSERFWSPVLDNPRNFIWDKTNETLILPVYYYPTSVSDEWQFQWIKVLSISPKTWIKERMSKNFIDYWYKLWSFNSMSVWYVWDTLYWLSDLFSHFVHRNSWVEKHIVHINSWNAASDPEFLDALQRMYKNWLTKYDAPVSYRLHDRVTDEQSTKFFVQLYKLLHPEREFDKNVLDKPLRYTWIDYSLEPFAQIATYDLWFGEVLYGANRQNNLTRDVMSSALIDILWLEYNDSVNACSVLHTHGLIKNCDHKLWISRYHMALLLYRAYISTLDDEQILEINRHQDWKMLWVETY